jgi:hypothetical protein
MKDIRNSLWISTLDDRFDDITEAHRRTFGWIYREPEFGARKWSNFDRWLRSGEGAYWINGKPGSGKSTLVKFLYQDSRTEVALKEWGGSNEVVTASFYFWNSGMHRQRTEESMLRNLIFRSMRKREDLIPVVLEEHLTQATYRVLKSGGFHWSLAQLRRCFIKLVQQKTIRVNLVFMIDGLDEFEGNYQGFTAWLLSLMTPSVKMVLSSRPWNVFQDAFQSLPRLRLQDLTHNDITAYVEDHLNDHSHMKQLSQKDPEQAEALTTDIVSKASGVFLWVRIVVRSLLDGLMNRDKISDLQRRLNLLPDDLDALYTHILSQSESIYHTRRSQYLLMRQVYDEPPLTLAFSLADEKDPEMCLKAKMKLLTKGEAIDRCEEMERRLQASCAGLLEVDYRANSKLLESERRRPLLNHDYYRSAYGSKIQFMHRTVKDFFEDKERIAKICSVVEGTSFDPHIALLRSWILRLKVLPSHFLGVTMSVGGCGNVEALYEEAIKFAEIAEKNTGVSQKELLKELERTVKHLHRLWGLRPGGHSTTIGGRLSLLDTEEGSTFESGEGTSSAHNPIQEITSTKQNETLGDSQVSAQTETTISLSALQHHLAQNPPKRVHSKRFRWLCMK